jgi:glycerophosphoryl diester phosphodiesterase
VKVVGHRGAPQAAPEDTMAAFRAARDMGADGVELDVHATRDGELVVIHDYTVDRTTDGTGLVLDLSADEISRLDAGRWLVGAS